MRLRLFRLRLTSLAALSVTIALAVAVHSHAQLQPHSVGIPSIDMDYIASDQRNSQWCWAASIQMVLNYRGIAISQEQIVARTYGTDPFGRLPNWAGSFEAITANLNNWNIDNRGRLYSVEAVMVPGPPAPQMLIQELGYGMPVIVGYQSGPNSGHAVVVTGVTFSTSRMGPIIHTIVVRDPWPSPANIMNLGRAEYGGADFTSRIMAHWYIRIR